MIDLTRFERVRSEWLAITQPPPPNYERFREVKRQANALVDAGMWTSGPSDMLSVLGRQRDELIHSRLLAWLLVPTNRHGLGRALLSGLLDAVWPEEDLMRTGPVFVDTEVYGAGTDPDGRLREAWADIVVRCERLTVVIENKLDAGEQPDQCERLSWGWAGDPTDTRWLFLTPTGRAPVTAVSESARSAWRSIGYREVRRVMASTVDAASPSDSVGRRTALQYLTTLTEAVAR
jgi:hypothetical protein